MVRKGNSVRGDFNEEECKFNRQNKAVLLGRFRLQIPLLNCVFPDQFPWGKGRMLMRLLLSPAAISRYPQAPLINCPPVSEI